MAVVCGVCSTDNRDGARFCKGCGAKLKTAGASASVPDPLSDWPSTAPVPLSKLETPALSGPVDDEATLILGAARAAASAAPVRPLHVGRPPLVASVGAPSMSPSIPPAQLPDAPTVLQPPPTQAIATPSASATTAPAPKPPAHAYPASAAPSPSPSSNSTSTFKSRAPSVPAALVSRSSGPVPLSARKRRKRAKGVRIFTGLLVLLIVAAGAAWVGLDNSEPPVRAAAVATGPVSPAAPPVAAAAPAALDPVAPAATADAPSVAPVMPSVSANARPPGPAAALPAPSLADAAVRPRQTASAPQIKPRKAPAAAASAPAEPVAAVAAPAPPPVAPAPSPDPENQCAGRNFISKAQCMATQCQKPENRTHVQCEGVRRQQRLEEEKRNPSNVN